MKTKQLILSSLLILLTSHASQAEDIDIYSGTTSNGVPNLMFVVDNPSSQNSNMGVCTYWDGTLPSEGDKSVGNDQCALANVVHEMSPLGAGSAVVNLGITTMCGIHFPLTPIDNNLHPGTPYTRTFNTGPCNAASDNITYTVPAGSTNKDAFIIAVKALKTNSGKSGQGSELQETWAYYTGGNDGSGLTGRGILTGTTYAGAAGVTTGCQKNYIIYLSGVKAGASHAQQYDATELSKLTSATANAVANGTLTAAQKTTLDTIVTPALEAGQGREWARFLRALDINTTPAPVAPATTPPEGTGVQSIITYSIATGDTAVPPAAITNNMEAYIKAVSTYGGGKYYPVGTDYNALKNAILKILNEVQAVNSVFSSSSLPVSVNAQGTYLNQIYMGMFRPDPDGNPRWVGNLKQYHFVATRDMVSQLVSLSLSDSLDASAINPATGFITPSAVSFWTCGGSPSVRACSPVADVAGGFWVNDSTKTADSAGKAYDLPDGEWVDKGGAAQIVRLANLTNNYATAAGTATNPRKLYTCTGACASGNSLSSYLFSSDPAVNPSLTSSAFGIITPVSITSLTRSGSTATVTTAAAHGVTDGQVVQISGANESEYNGSFVMTVVDATHVTYTLNVAPATPATGTILASVPGAGVAISSLTRVGSTVTVTTGAANGLSDGNSVNISGVTPTAYNGTWTVSGCGGVCGLTFNFTGPAEGPVTPSGSGTAAVSGKTTRTIELVTAAQGQTATPGLVRAGTTVTVQTTANHGFATGDLVTIAGAGDSGYNIASRAITVTGNRTFTYTLTGTTPTTPATIAGATASPVTVAPVSISSLTRTLGAGAAATATATTASSLTAAPYNKVVGNSYSISVSGASQSEYNGTFNAAVTSATTFTYPITTSPATTATGTMMLGSNLATADLIKWIRGDDNFGDEVGPGGSVTIRPSLHGDVLHSRPVAVNYGTYAINITATSDALGTRTATASAANVAIISSLAVSARSVTFANGQSCMVTVASATTFTYSTTNCGASGTQAASVGPTVVVYYGGNDGVFRAVNGNQTAAITTASGEVPPGGELWGFIPSEFFSKLKRLHDNSPILDLPSTTSGISPTPQKKDYFVDGSTGIYQKLNADGTTAKAYLYLTMRRGGRYIYALDVTAPADPKYLWKITNAGNFTELGQTWSAPKVALIKGYCGAGVTCSAVNKPTPVLIFGAGYDPTEDTEPAGTDAMGRGIYIVDAETGVLIWRATYGAASNCSAAGTVPATCTILGMNYSIPADITLMDSDYDGYIDRLYAVDVGGNIWRVDTQRSAVNYTPDYWRVNKVASLGGTCCPLRKFFYPVDVVPAGSYDAIIAGSGDREHPLYTNAAADKQNRIFMLKDLTGSDGSGLTTIVRTKLFNATSATYSAAAAAEDGTAPNKGYYIDLLNGEKVVNAPLTVAGYTYLGTNQPTASNSCSANLGIARGYRLGPLSGAYTSTVFAGGGLPPSPVAGVVSVTVAGETTPSLVPFVIGGGGDPGCVGADCSSALGGAKPSINVSTSRTRTYWYQEVD
ncbi:MAG: PilC/PilY family type IV pilus protein [Gallionella sp.]|nr:PilC/PilY family type IV pilus protein [Gallionella sp.]